MPLLSIPDQTITDPYVAWTFDPSDHFDTAQSSPNTVDDYEYRINVKDGQPDGYVYIDGAVVDEFDEQFTGGGFIDVFGARSTRNLTGQKIVIQIKETLNDVATGTYEVNIKVLYAAGRDHCDYVENRNIVFLNFFALDIVEQNWGDYFNVSASGVSYSEDVLRYTLTNDAFEQTYLFSDTDITQQKNFYITATSVEGEKGEDNIVVYPTGTDPYIIKNYPIVLSPGMVRYIRYDTWNFDSLFADQTQIPQYRIDITLDADSDVVSCTLLNSSTTPSVSNDPPFSGHSYIKCVAGTRTGQANGTLDIRDIANDTIFYLRIPFVIDVYDYCGNSPDPSSGIKQPFDPYVLPPGYERPEQVYTNPFVTTPSVIDDTKASITNVLPTQLPEDTNYEVIAMQRGISSKRQINAQKQQIQLIDGQFEYKVEEKYLSNYTQEAPIFRLVGKVKNLEFEFPFSN